MPQVDVAEIGESTAPYDGDEGGGEEHEYEPGHRPWTVPPGVPDRGCDPDATWTGTLPPMGGTTVRVVRGTGWTLIWLGLLSLAFVAYQLWGTGLLTGVEQTAGSASLERRFEDLREEPLPALALSIDADGSVDESVLTPRNGPVIPESAPAQGEALAVITFPTLRRGGSPMPTGDVDVEDLLVGAERHVVWSGEDLRTLRKGPGHYLDTPLPGQPGNASVAGHRTTYGAPFNRLDELRPGDPIVVETTIGRHVYVVRDPRAVHDRVDDGQVGQTGGWFVVPPSATWVVGDLRGGWLTLTTCHPLFSSRQRLIVVAELVEGPNAGAVENAGGG
jgi:sortase A